MPKHYIDLYCANANYRDGRGMYPLNVSFIVDKCQAIPQVFTRCTAYLSFLSDGSNVRLQSRTYTPILHGNHLHGRYHIDQISTVLWATDYKMNVQTIRLGVMDIINTINIFLLHSHTFIYIYIYMCVCVCVLKKRISIPTVPLKRTFRSTLYSQKSFHVICAIYPSRY